jgi:hypothetical protein
MNETIKYFCLSEVCAERPGSFKPVQIFELNRHGRCAKCDRVVKVTKTRQGLRHMATTRTQMSQRAGGVPA